MKTIAILNSKGGIGKTTLSVTLAAGLAGVGKRVVVVDTDPQGNVAKWFGMNEESGVYDLLIKERPVEELLRLVPPGQWWPGETSGVLAVLPGNTRTTTAGVALAVDRAPANHLRCCLEPLGGVDFVILDTAPTVTELMANVFVAADFAIVPTETQILSVNGVHKTMGRLAVAQSEHVSLTVLGIQPTKHSSRLIECRENLAELVDVYGDQVWRPIELRTAWSAAPSYRRSIFAYEKRGHRAVQEAALFVKTCWETLAEMGAAL